MKVTLHLEGNNSQLIAGAQEFIKNLLGQAAAETETAAPAKKAGKKAAAPKDEEEEETEFSDDSETETEETEEEEEAEEESDVTLDDVRAACQAHAKKHDRDATKALLKKKFGVKSPQELKAGQYEAAIAALKK